MKAVFFSCLVSAAYAVPHLRSDDLVQVDTVSIPSAVETPEISEEIPEISKNSEEISEISENSEEISEISENSEEILQNSDENMDLISENTENSQEISENTENTEILDEFVAISEECSADDCLTVESAIRLLVQAIACSVRARGTTQRGIFGNRLFGSTPRNTPTVASTMGPEFEKRAADMLKKLLQQPLHATVRDPELKAMADELARFATNITEADARDFLNIRETVKLSRQDLEKLAQKLAEALNEPQELPSITLTEKDIQALADRIVESAKGSPLNRAPYTLEGFGKFLPIVTVSEEPSEEPAPEPVSEPVIVPSLFDGTEDFLDSEDEKKEAKELAIQETKLAAENTLIAKDLAVTNKANEALLFKETALSQFISALTAWDAFKQALVN